MVCRRGGVYPISTSALWVVRVVTCATPNARTSQGGNFAKLGRLIKVWQSAGERSCAPGRFPSWVVVALSLAVPSGAEARLRFGPGVVLGAVAGAMFGFRLHSDTTTDGRQYMHRLARAALHVGSGARWPARRDLK